MSPLHPARVRDRRDPHARLHHGDPAAAVAAALGVLRREGERVTEPRRVVIEVLAQSGAHLGAEELVAAVEAVAPGIHRATVYRTLERLTGIGVVSHLHGATGSALYHLSAVAPGHEHLHARCRGCGRIVELPADALDAAVARLSADFRLEPGQSALVGLCRDCARTAG